MQSYGDEWYVVTSALALENEKYLTSFSIPIIPELPYMFCNHQILKMIMRNFEKIRKKGKMRYEKKQVICDDKYRVCVGRD